MPSERLPPAQPVYVLRGHDSQIHAVQFSADNMRLVTADADGWVVCWGMVYKRPQVVWRAHSDAVLGLAWWDATTVISHGRDSKLVVWDLKPAPVSLSSTRLPLDEQDEETERPEILYELSLNTLNFCAFAHCLDPSPPLVAESAQERSPLLLAVPHTLDSEAIDVFQLPSASRLATIPAPKSPEMGMVMSLAILTTQNLAVVVAGYESGHCIVWSHPKSDVTPAAEASRPSLYSGTWTRLYQSQPHKQPILSLAVSTDQSFFVTTSADAIVAKHPLSELQTSASEAAEQPLKTVQTKHSGQQGVSMRDDGKIFATAGWDARVRVYASRSMREVAVLKWHKDGCYATSFAHVLPQLEDGNENDKTLAKEPSKMIENSSETTMVKLPELGESVRGDEVNMLMARRLVKAQRAHLLAAGAKDGRISLWDIF